MSLPCNAFTISGGCNCGAIRYEASVPQFESRPKNPYRTPGAKDQDVGGDFRLPMVVIDHCNDCRRATGALLPMALILDISWVSTTCSLKNTENKTRRMLASELFEYQSVDKQDVYLTFYKSTPKRSRWFCSKCGTNLAYTIDDGAIPMEWGWPRMLDLWLGTVDRNDLEILGPPERMLWCEKGIPWVKDFARNGAAVPEHPTTRIDELA